MAHKWPPEIYLKVALLTWNFGSRPEIDFKTTLFSNFYHFNQPLLTRGPLYNDEKGVYLPLLTQNGRNVAISVFNSNLLGSF